VFLEAVKRRREKRSGRRYPVAWKLQGRGISFLGFRHGDEEALQGRVLNINHGGLCLLTEQPIEKSEFPLLWKSDGCNRIPMGPARPWACAF